jgi:hypothetical protein
MRKFSWVTWAFLVGVLLVVASYFIFQFTNAEHNSVLYGLGETLLIVGSCGLEAGILSFLLSL